MDILLNKGIHIRNNYVKYQEITAKEFSEEIRINNSLEA